MNKMDKLNERDTKNIVMYEVASAVMRECFIFVHPVLRQLEENKHYRTRKEKREALKNFDTGVKKTLKLLSVSSEIIENDFSTSTQNCIDQIIELMDKIIEVK